MIKISRVYVDMRPGGQVIIVIKWCWPQPPRPLPYQTLIYISISFLSISTSIECSYNIEKGKLMLYRVSQKTHQ